MSMLKQAKRTRCLSSCDSHADSFGIIIPTEIATLLSPQVELPVLFLLRVGGTHNGAHAFCRRIQSGMPQYTTHKDGHLLWPHLKADKTILPVADLTPIKTTISREEGRPIQVMQE
jgi:hypothetical protein